jgi:acetoin utilization deacetylase AcuC-like enzyme
MLIYRNPLHQLHSGRHEMYRGRLVPCNEVPGRLDQVAAELQRRAIATLQVPNEPADLDVVLARTHSPRYLDFLRGAWDEWLALDPAHAELDALPSVWPGRGFRHELLPRSFAARMGLFSFDAGTPITAGAWPAARAGAACAIAAARSLGQGVERSAFVLTRPPGHHAGTDFFGGYCFLNNAALAAQALRDAGAARVAVLDVDYHHGNGTQSIFYARDDVLTVSVHGDPSTEYPFFLGHADEAGIGAGEGFNLNLPLPRGSGVTVWREALRRALETVRTYRTQALVVALGVDTFEGDPISGFTLRSADFLQVGQAIGSLDLPTVLVLEGGYAVAEVGVNVANVLEGFGR